MTVTSAKVKRKRDRKEMREVEEGIWGRGRYMGRDRGRKVRKGKREKRGEKRSDTEQET